MSEQGRQRVFSPLESAGGTTTIKDAVVSRIAGMAAEEVDGVRPGGAAARRAGGLLERTRVSSGTTPGVSVEVGQTEVAVDLKLGVRYGADLRELTGKVRERVVNRIENLVGLAVTEVNVTITDIVFPDQEGPELRGKSAGYEREQDQGGPDSVPSGPPGTRERGVKRVEPRSRTHTEAESGPVPEEEVRVKDTPLSPDESAEYDVVEDEVEKRPEGRRGRRGDGRGN